MVLRDEKSHVEKSKRRENPAGKEIGITKKQDPHVIGNSQEISETEEKIKELKKPQGKSSEILIKG